MLGVEVADPLLAHERRRARIGGKHLVLKQRPELAAKPCSHWDAEAMLAAFPDAPGQHGEEGAPENRLEPPQAYLLPRRHVGQALDDGCVQERRASLERV